MADQAIEIHDSSSYRHYIAKGKQTQLVVFFCNSGDFI